jgi:hypothetical protein
VCSLCLLLTLAFCAAAAAPTLAAELEPGNSFNKLNEETENAQTQTQTTPAGTGEGPARESTSNSKGLILLGMGAMIVLLSGIAFVIVRDARKVAPAGEVDALEVASARDNAVQLQRRRAKAKAARQQRKRNRSR